MRGFDENISKKTAFFAKISGTIRAIEIAYHNHWHNL
jgi:hypothetical protein